MNEMCMLFKKAEVLCESVEVRTITEKKDEYEEVNHQGHEDEVSVTPNPELDN